MKADRKEQEILLRAINEWEHTGKISHEQARDLKDDVSSGNAGNNPISQYFFIIALSCILLAFGAIFIDDKLLEQVKTYFALSNLFITAICGIIAAGWIGYVYKRRSKLGKNTYEVYMGLGALAVLTTLIYACKDIGAGHGYNGFLALSAIVLFILSVSFRAKAFWLIGLLAMMGWYGAFTDWLSRDFLFLGMNYPVRFTLFGLLVMGLSYLQQKIVRLHFTHRITYIVGLLIFFTGFWGISVFGNFNHYSEWLLVRQTRVLIYAILFGLGSIAAFFLGIRYKDDFTRDCAVLFFIANLYTRYFEYFWGNMNKGIFFLVLAVLFWFTGRWLDKRKRSVSH